MSTYEHYCDLHCHRYDDADGCPGYTDLEGNEIEDADREEGDCWPKPGVTFEDVVADFEENILPRIHEVYEGDGAPDIPARSEEWNNYTDYLCREGIITSWQYENWGHPDCCNR